MIPQFAQLKHLITYLPTINIHNLRHTKTAIWIVYYTGFWTSFETFGILSYHRVDGNSLQLWSNSFLVISSKDTDEYLHQKVRRNKNPHIGRYCSRASVSFSLAVACRLAFKSPPFHNTLKSFTNPKKTTEINLG